MRGGVVGALAGLGLLCVGVGYGQEGVVCRAEVLGGDTVAVVELGGVVVYGPLRFADRRSEERYRRLVRDVKRTLPYAKLVYATLVETYEYMETLPDDVSRARHLRRLERELYRDYKGELRRLSLSQGKLLIRLIARECNQSSYNLLRAYLGGFRAGVWNVFAGLLGANLKVEYEPEGRDALTERVVVMVESGLL